MSNLEFKVIKLTNVTSVSSEDQTDVNIAVKLIQSVFAFNTIFSGEGLPDRPTNYEESFAFITSNNGFRSVGTIKNYYVALTQSSGIILSACILIEKETSTHTYLEIWSLVSNPFYMRSGSTKFLIYNIIHQAFENNFVLLLQVAPESFPFITFYDRLLMYYKLGFEVITDSLVNGIGVNGIQTINLKNIDVGEDEEHVYFRYNNHMFELEEMKEILPVLDLQDKDSPVVMRFEKRSFSEERVKKIIESFQPIELKSIPNMGFAGKTYGVLFHSEYKLEEGLSNVFRSNMLPPNVELVIINTPGWNTYSDYVHTNWDFVQAYLAHYPIEQLQLIFGGMKPDIFGNLPTPMMNCDNGIAFMKSIEQSLLFHFLDKETYQHIHCYAPGQIYPDLQLSVKIGPSSDDWLSAIHGVYEINSRYGKVDKPLMPLSRRIPTTYGSLAAYAEAEEIIGFPQLIDPTSGEYVLNPKLLPMDDQYPPGSFTDGIDLAVSISGLLGELNKKDTGLKRVFIFSCGQVDKPEINDQLKQVAANYVVGRLVETENTEQYLHQLTILADTLYVTFGHNLGGGKRKRSKTYKKRYARRTKSRSHRKMTQNK